jgi:hypothetical protein
VQANLNLFYFGAPLMLLSVVIPVMNEQGNIAPLIERIAEALAHTPRANTCADSRD